MADSDMSKWNYVKNNFDEYEYLLSVVLNYLKFKQQKYISKNISID